MIGHTDLESAERTYLTQLDSYLHDLERDDRSQLVAELADELRTKPPASDLEALVTDIGEPADMAARLRESHALPPGRRRATATAAGALLLLVAALAAAGLAASWWLTYEAELDVTGFAAGHGEILDPTGIDTQVADGRDQLLIGYRSDQSLQLLLELSNLDTRAITITSVSIDDTLVELVESRWRWTSPMLPADVGPISDVRLEPDGERSTVRLLLTLTFDGCAAHRAGDTTTVSTIDVHYDALGRARTNPVELPKDLVLVSPPDEACPART